MMTKIGLISGEIITVLEEVKGPLTMKEIQVYLGEETDVILMSIGCLIREGLLEVVKTNGSAFYRLLNKA